MPRYQTGMAIKAPNGDIFKYDDSLPNHRAIQNNPDYRPPTREEFDAYMQKAKKGEQPKESGLVDITDDLKGHRKQMAEMYAKERQEEAEFRERTMQPNKSQAAYMEMTKQFKHRR